MIPRAAVNQGVRDVVHSLPHLAFVCFFNCGSKCRCETRLLVCTECHFAILTTPHVISSSRPRRLDRNTYFHREPVNSSHLKEGDDDGSHHDEGRVEDGPEDQRDGQSTRLGELFDIWPRLSKISHWVCNNSLSCSGDVGMKDTLFDDLVFEAGELLHHDVDETGNEARQKADQAADDPAADLQAAETLQRCK